MATPVRRPEALPTIVRESIPVIAQAIVAIRTHQAKPQTPVQPRPTVILITVGVPTGRRIHVHRLRIPRIRRINDSRVIPRDCCINFSGVIIRIDIPIRLVITAAALVPVIIVGISEHAVGIVTVIIVTIIIIVIIIGVAVVVIIVVIIYHRRRAHRNRMNDICLGMYNRNIFMDHHLGRFHYYRTMVRKIEIGPDANVDACPVMRPGLPVQKYPARRRSRAIRIESSGRSARQTVTHTGGTVAAGTQSRQRRTARTNS